jgi:hypothetical protein
VHFFTKLVFAVPRATCRPLPTALSSQHFIIKLVFAAPDTSPRSRFDRAICKGSRWPDDMAGSFVATADGHGGTLITKVQQTQQPLLTHPQV